MNKSILVTALLVASFAISPAFAQRQLGALSSGSTTTGAVRELLVTAAGELVLSTGGSSTTARPFGALISGSTSTGTVVDILVDSTGALIVSGGITGTCANTQVLYGTGASTFGCDAGLTYVSGTDALTVVGSITTNGTFSVGGASTFSGAITGLTTASVPTITATESFIVPSSKSYQFVNSNTQFVASAANTIRVDTGGSGRWTWDASGNYAPVTDSGPTIGDATHRPLSIFGMSLVINGATATGTVNFNGSGYWSGLTTTTGALASALCLAATNEIETNTNAGGCLVSAARFKRNVADMDMGLSEVLRLRPITYDFTPETKRDGRWMGFLAEEALAVDERLGFRTPDGEALGFNYLTYPAVLTKGIQEMYALIEAQSRRIEALERRP